MFLLTREDWIAHEGSIFKAPSDHTLIRASEPFNSMRELPTSLEGPRPDPNPRYRAYSKRTDRRPVRLI